MIGCSFVVNRKFFGEIGLLDPGMDVYGGENIELGIKVCATWAAKCHLTVLSELLLTWDPSGQLGGAGVDSILISL